MQNQLFQNKLTLNKQSSLCVLSDQKLMEGFNENDREEVSSILLAIIQQFNYTGFSMLASFVKYTVNNGYTGLTVTNGNLVFRGKDAVSEWDAFILTGKSSVKFFESNWILLK